MTGSSRRIHRLRHHRGKSYEAFAKYPDLEIDLYLDSNHRMMRLEVPTAKVSVIRE
jgi:hypothetical protein